MAGIEQFEDHCWRDVVPSEVLRVYEPYRRTTGVRGKAALLAVDLFAAVFPTGPEPLLEAVGANPRSCGPYAWQAMPALRRLLDLCRSAGLPVLFSTAALDDSGSPQSHRATFRQAGRAERAAADVAIHPDFAPADGERVIRKRRASVFFETGLADVLRELGTETLVLCGESTSGCVRATAVDAFSHGFHVVVVEDAVFDRSLLSHQVSLFDLHHKYADVMTLAELHGHLTGGGAR